MSGGKNKAWLKHFDFMLLDIISLIISFCLANFLRHGTFKFVHHEAYLNTFIVMLLIEIVMVFFYEPFKNVLKRDMTKELTITFTFVFFNLLGTSLYIYASKNAQVNSRLVIAYTYIIYFFISFITRFMLKSFIRNRSSKLLRANSKSLLVITNKKKLKKDIEKLTKNSFDNYYISGLCITDDDNKEKELYGYPVVTSIDNALEWCCRQWIDGVFFGIDINKIPKNLIDGLATAGITMHYAFSDSYSIEGQVQSIDKIGSHNVITSSNREYSNGLLLLKRLMDIVLGFVGCVITMIIALIIGPIIYIKSPGPIFYTSERIGMNGRRFKMYKFRSMIPNAEALKKDLAKDNIIKDGMMFKMKDDPRVIPGIGNFIRKTSLDEFPQFFNVLKGDMSIVGTRPPTPDEWEKYSPEHRMRMSIKPGVTGLWQISGRSSIVDFDQVIKLDKQYIDNWNFWYDIKIIFKTVLYLLNRKDDAM